MDLNRRLLPDPYDFVPALPAVDIRSDDFANGQALPPTAGFAAGNISPQLAWDLPEGTAAVLLSCFDVDAPVIGGFLHWAVVLPGDTTELPTAAAGGGLPEGSVELLNDFGMSGWGGCAPPEGDVPHRYYFAVTALDTTDHGITADMPFAKAQFTNLGAMTARGVVMGTYQL